jgi:hypothetical protein
MMTASKSTIEQVEPHALALEGCADAMAAAGIGCAPVTGHADYLRAMAYSLRSQAAKGILPSSTTTMNGVQDMPNVTDTAPPSIKAAMETSDFRAVSHLVRKYSLDIDRIQTIAEFDLKLRAKALPPVDRIALKSALTRAGLLV